MEVLVAHTRVPRALVVEVIRRVFVRTIGLMGFLVPLASMLVCLWLLFQPGMKTWSAIMLGLFSIYFAVFAIAYFARIRQAKDYLSLAAHDDVEYRFTESAFGLKSALGESTLDWKLVKGLWRFPEYWLLMLGPLQFVILPVDILSAEIRELLLRKVPLVDKRIPR